MSWLIRLARSVVLFLLALGSTDYGTASQMLAWAMTTVANGWSFEHGLWWATPPSLVLTPRDVPIIALLILWVAVVVIHRPGWSSLIVDKINALIVSGPLLQIHQRQTIRKLKWSMVRASARIAQVINFVHPTRLFSLFLLRLFLLLNPLLQVVALLYYVLKFFSRLRFQISTHGWADGHCLTMLYASSTFLDTRAPPDAAYNKPRMAGLILL